MRITRRFGFLYLQDWEILDAITTRTRMTALDGLLYGFAKQCGEGIGEGGEVTVSDGQIQVNSFVGIVDGFVVISDGASFPVPADGEHHITIKAGTDAPYDNTAIVEMDGDGLPIAKIVVSDGAVTSIEEENRGIELGKTARETLEQLLRTHRHDGTEIDRINLASEVTGTLNYRALPDIPPSKIDGQFTLNQLPPMSHFYRLFSCEPEKFQALTSDYCTYTISEALSDDFAVWRNGELVSGDEYDIIGNGVKFHTQQPADSVIEIAPDLRRWRIVKADELRGGDVLVYVDSVRRLADVRDGVIIFDFPVAATSTVEVGERHWFITNDGTISHRALEDRISAPYNAGLGHRVGEVERHILGTLAVGLCQTYGASFEDDLERALNQRDFGPGFVWWWFSTVEYDVSDVSTHQVDEITTRVEFPGDKLHLILVIDQSGSMASNDPDDLRIQAALSLVDYFGGDAIYTVLGFGDSVYTYIEASNDTNAVKNAINQCTTRSENTNLYGAIYDSMKYTTAGDNCRGVIVLLTDGRDTVGMWPSVEALLEVLSNDTDAVIFPVALGDQADLHVLGILAEEFNGHISQALSADDLEVVYGGLRTYIESALRLTRYAAETEVTFSELVLVTDIVPIFSSYSTSAEIYVSIANEAGDYGPWRRYNGEFIITDRLRVRLEWSSYRPVDLLTLNIMWAPITKTELTLDLPDMPRIGRWQPIWMGQGSGGMEFTLVCADYESSDVKVALQNGRKAIPTNNLVKIEDYDSDTSVWQLRVRFVGVRSGLTIYGIGLWYSI